MEIQTFSIFNNQQNQIMEYSRKTGNLWQLKIDPDNWILKEYIIDDIDSY